ncbi:MAG: hypothetical protein ACOYBR_06990 [Fluviibacter sp.]
MGFLYTLYKALSPQMRYRAKRWVGGLGHHASLLDSLKANKDALGKRRLDIAFCHFLEMYSRLQNKSLAGLRCIDFGAGYVISDSLVMWLLGAARVDTLDYNPIARSSALRKAVIAMDETHLLNFACKFGFVDMRDLSERLARLKRLAQVGDIPLEALGIYYQAPFDATKAEHLRQLVQVDLVWSTSVLEHIHPKYLAPILTNLAMLLSPWGAMLHLIDARDHLDLEEAPFGFLEDGSDYLLDRDYDARGNRLSWLEWRGVSGDMDIHDAETEVIGLNAGFESMPYALDSMAHFYLLMAKKKTATYAHTAHH